ncbi:MAG: hypothetical protein RLY17_168 [Pseudomonadota bacterium]|jgi:hypothetical protein
MPGSTKGAEEKTASLMYIFLLTSDQEGGTCGAETSLRWHNLDQVIRVISQPYHGLFVAGTPSQNRYYHGQVEEDQRCVRQKTPDQGHPIPCCGSICTDK